MAATFGIQVENRILHLSTEPSTEGMLEQARDADIVSEFVYSSLNRKILEELSSWSELQSGARASSTRQVLTGRHISRAASDEPHDDSACLTSEGRIVGVCPSSFGDASGWCKELIALSILNLPVTSSRLFHRVINKLVEK